jgi:multidrug resistance efflux pump
MKEGTRGNHVAKHYYLRHAVPVTVWLVTAAMVVWLFYQRAERFQVVGIARGQIRQIAASSTGRIKEIPVQLFTPVKTGQVLAIVDTIAESGQVDEAKLRADLAAAGAEAGRLSALLIPTQEKLRVTEANFQMSREDSRRRFQVDVDSARLRILDLQATIASDRVALDDLVAQIEVNRKLVEEDAIVPYELERLKAQHDSLAEKVAQNEQALEQARAICRQAEQRRDEFARDELPVQSEDAALEAIRKEIGVQEEVMKGLLAQLAALKACRAVELKSPIDGIVIPIPARRNDTLQQRPGEQVVRRPGEVVAAGDPILAVAQDEPNEIVAYVNERQLGQFEKGMSVELVKSRMPAQIAPSTVVSVGPAIELMPQRLWRNPNVPQWGRPVLIEIPEGLSLVPGELVGIRRL